MGSLRKVKIEDKLVDKGEPVFTVAEAGVNHNGDINLAKKLIDAAKNARADAVKFQAFKTEAVVSKYAAKAEYQKRTTGTGETQYEMIRKLELKQHEIVELFNYAKKRDLVFLSSAFDKESVDLLDSLGVPAFKVASGEITNFPLLRCIARKKKPVILSTGMSTIKEIEETLRFLKEEGVKDIVLLHCITGYPARVEDANLKMIEMLRKRFRVPVGFSDHTLGATISIAAATLGAVLIEKHFTLDKNLPGPDHKASLEPYELKKMIAAIRDVEKALGTGVRTLTKDEKEIKSLVRRSLVAKVDISKGTIIAENMLDIKRPGTGIDPRRRDEVIGKRAKENIRADELITLEKLD